MFFVFEKIHQSLQFHLYISISWLVTSFFANYYKVYRFTNLYRLVKLIVVQGLFFTLVFFAYFGIFKEGEIVNTQFKTLVITLGSLALIKVAFFILQKKIRQFGSNFKRVIFFEKDDTAKKMIKLFQKKSSLGYLFLGFFSSKTSEDPNYLGKEKDLYDYLNTEKVDEVYDWMEPDLNQGKAFLIEEVVRKYRQLTADDQRKSWNIERSFLLKYRSSVMVVEVDNNERLVVMKGFSLTAVLNSAYMQKKFCSSAPNSETESAVQNIKHAA